MKPSVPLLCRSFYDSRFTILNISFVKSKGVFWPSILTNLPSDHKAVYADAPCSLRTADAFPVVASLPPIFRRERGDDRKCVCCSQANAPWSQRARSLLQYVLFWRVLIKLSMDSQTISTCLSWNKYLLFVYPGGGGTPIHYLYGYVPPKGVVILKLLI